MKTTLFFFSMLLLFSNLSAQEEVKIKDGRTVIINNDGTWKYKQGSTANNTFKDSRDGHIYKFVTIGTQIWFAENLAYKANSGCWAYKLNNQTNDTTYGYLYDWETAKKVCPSGWHLPSDAEWTTLTNYLGGDDVAGKKMKSTIGWSKKNNNTNTSGFAGLPGGYSSLGSFANFDYSGNWWSSTGHDTYTYSAWKRELYNDSDRVGRYNGTKQDGLSVRCLKD